MIDSTDYGTTDYATTDYDTDFIVTDNLTDYHNDTIETETSLEIEGIGLVEITIRFLSW